MLTTFIAQIKTMLHRPAMIFWALAFPIILATMFHAMFQNIASSYSIEAQPIDIVRDDAWDGLTGAQDLVEALQGRRHGRAQGHAGCRTRTRRSPTCVRGRAVGYLAARGRRTGVRHQRFGRDPRPNPDGGRGHNPQHHLGCRGAVQRHGAAGGVGGSVRSRSLSGRLLHRAAGGHRGVEHSRALRPHGPGRTRALPVRAAGHGLSDDHDPGHPAPSANPSRICPPSARAVAWRRCRSGAY